MNEEIREAIESVLEYLWGDEQADYEDNDEPESHVFVQLLKISDWMDTA